MKRIFLFSCLAILFTSCKSDDDSQTEFTLNDNFYALTVGNSWVYKTQRYNHADEEYYDVGIIDSVSIIGTETILGDTYFIFRTLTIGNDSGSPFSNQNGEKFEFLREISGELVDVNGETKFVNNDFSERLIYEQPWGNIYERLIEEEIEISVPAGMFQCQYKKRYSINSEGEMYDGMDYFYYSPEIGLIFDTRSSVTFGTPQSIRRLDSYNIN